MYFCQKGTKSEGRFWGDALYMLSAHLLYIHTSYTQTPYILAERLHANSIYLHVACRGPLVLLPLHNIQYVEEYYSGEVQCRDLEFISAIAML